MTGLTPEEHFRLGGDVDMFGRSIRRDLHLWVHTEDGDEASNISISATDGNNIYLNPTSWCIPDSDGRLAALRHEYAHILFKSSDAVTDQLSEDEEKLKPQGFKTGVLNANVIHSVYNILEDYRIEDNWIKIFPPNAEFFAQLKQRMVEHHKQQNIPIKDPINTLLAVRIGDKSLMDGADQEFKDMYDQFVPIVAELSGKDYLATYPVQAKVDKIIRDWYLKHKDEIQQKNQKQYNEQTTQQVQQANSDSKMRTRHREDLIRHDHQRQADSDAYRRGGNSGFKKQQEKNAQEESQIAKQRTEEDEKDAKEIAKRQAEQSKTPEGQEAEASGTMDIEQNNATGKARENCPILDETDGHYGEVRKPTAEEIDQIKKITKVIVDNGGGGCFPPSPTGGKTPLGPIGTEIHVNPNANPQGGGIDITGINPLLDAALKKILEQSAKNGEAERKDAKEKVEHPPTQSKLEKTKTQNEKINKDVAQTDTQQPERGPKPPIPMSSSEKIKSIISEIKRKREFEETEYGRKINMKKMIQKIIDPNRRGIRPFRREQDTTGSEFWFLIDVSDSMSGTPLSIEKKALATLYDSVVPTNKDIKFRMFAFSTANGKPHVFEVKRNELGNLSTENSTPTGQALEFIYDKMRKEANASDKVFVLLTDGQPNCEFIDSRGIYPTTYETLKLIKSEGVSVFTIFANPTGEAFNKMTFSPSDKTFMVSDVNEVKPLLEKIVVGDIVKRVLAN